MKSSLFRGRFEAALDYVADHTIRKCIADMSDRQKRIISSNRRMLQLCSGNLSDEEQEFVLRMLNDDWKTKSQGTLVHFCAPTCCSCSDSCRTNVRKALELLFGSMFDPPLLYRWKGWEPAAHYLTRGLAVHSLLIFLWQWCMTSEDQLLWRQKLFFCCPLLVS